jgi:hypothetical protein
MLRTRRNSEGQPRFRETESVNQVDLGRKRSVGPEWDAGQGAEDTGLEIIAEQLETLSKIDWSRYRGG